jgi:ketosteroid isomerase-like protein
VAFADVDRVRLFYERADPVLRQAQARYPQTLEDFVAEIEAGSFPEATSLVDAFIDRAVEWHSLWAPEPYHGHAGFLRYVWEFMELMDDWRWESREFTAGPRGVVGVFVVFVTGRASRASVKQQISISYRLRGGRIVHYVEHLTTPEALVAIEAKSATGS